VGQVPSATKAVVHGGHTTKSRSRMPARSRGLLAGFKSSVDHAVPVAKETACRVPQQTRAFGENVPLSRVGVFGQGQNFTSSIAKKGGRRLVVTNVRPRSMRPLQDAARRTRQSA